MIPLNGAQHEIWINKQPLIIKRLLKDGDFIQYGQFRMIFQADPAKDRNQREVMQKDEPVLLQVNRHFLNGVQFTHDAISFDGGQNFARWDEIAYVEIIKDHQAGLGLAQIAITRDNSIELLPTQLNSISYKQLANLFNLLVTLTPVDLNIKQSGIDLHEAFPDAYFAAAYEKVYLPVSQNRRIAPADMNFVLNHIPLHHHFVQYNTLSLAFAAATSLILTLIVIFYTSFGRLNILTPQFFELFWEILKPIAVVMFSISMFIANLPFAVVLLQNLDTWLRQRKKRTRQVNIQ